MPIFAKDTRAMLEAALEGKEEMVLKFLEKGWGAISAAAVAGVWTCSVYK